MIKMNEELERAAKILKEGKTILYPTDTIWGIGCDVRNESAVKKISEIKKRPDDKSFIVLIAEIGQLNDYVQKVPAIAWDVVDFAEKPLTVVYPGGRGVAPGITAQDGSIAIRLVRDEFCSKLIKKLGRAIVSTSANISGESSPENFSAVSPDILKAVDYVVNWRQDEKTAAKASTIMKIEMDGEVKFIRK